MVKAINDAWNEGDNEEEIQKIFNTMAEKNELPDYNKPVITFKQANILVDEANDILGIDCDPAKGYYEKTHNDYEKYFGNEAL